MTHPSLRAITQPELLYAALFDAMSGNSILLKNDEPRFTILAATPGYLAQTGFEKETLIGKSIFEAFPANNTAPADTGKADLLASYQHVLQYKETHFLPLQRYTLKNADGSFSERYWKASTTPVLSSEGEVAYIIHTLEDITSQIKAGQISEATKGIEKAYHIFMNAPVIVGILKGDDYIIELANEGLLEVWSRTEEVIGKPLLTVIPELETQGFIALLDQVRTTGDPFYAYEFPITLNRHGKEEVLYFDFVYKPIYEQEANGTASGVISVGHDVTAQVIARKSAQESQAKYRNLFESMDQGFCVIEMIFDENDQPTDYRFLEANPVFELQTGLKDAIGKTAREMVPDLESRWFDMYGKVSLTGEPIRFVEGSEAMGRWFDVFAFRVSDATSRKVAILFTDISEHKRAEIALQQSESNLRNMILQSPIAMAILRGPSFVVEIANDRMFELWGRGKADLLNKPLFVGLPEVKDQGYEELLTGVYTTGKTFSALGIPVTLPRSEGIDTVYINLLYEAFREADGTISGIMVVATDVTDQVTARMKVEESQKELQFVTDFMPQMIWVTRPDGHHYYYNKQWYDYTGLTYGETEGEGWNHVFHPDDQARAWKIWQHSLQTGEPYEIEYRCRRWDGGYRWFLGRALPLKDASGVILKWYGTCTDIDDQKKATERMEQQVEERTAELQKSNQQLQRSNQNLEEFAYAASHDLKEPMRKIELFSGRLKDDLQSTLKEQQKGFLDRILNATHRMNTLIDDLLMYSHVSSGGVMEDTVDLNQKVKLVLEDLDLEIDEKNASVTVNPLPTIRGHRRQLQQLFQNLISNAIKYSRPGEVPSVTISSRMIDADDQTLPVSLQKGDRQYYLIEVRDNGIGFAEEDAERIFNVFTRLHGNAEYKGTGVGLSIARKVVENHHGFIWAESVAGKGATFKVLLPAE